MLVARRTMTLSLALLVLLGLTSPRPAAAAVRRAGSGRRPNKKASDGHRRAQEGEEYTTTTTYIEPNDEARDGIVEDGYYGYGYGGSGKGKLLYTLGGKGSSCGGPYQMCCANPAARCVPGFGCNYNPDIIDPEASDKYENVTYPPYTCTPCGVPGQPCCKTSCSDEQCESECLEGGCNLFTNKCEGCGALDEVCCPGDRCPGANSTIGEVLVCNTDANKCEACGGDGEQCCPGDVCADGTLACNTVTGLCARCGVDEGDICCSGNKCPLYDQGESDDRLSCNTDAFPPTCEVCGDLGGKCCPLDDFNLPCDLDGVFGCNDSTGRCPDVEDENGNPPPAESDCRLPNGEGNVPDSMRATGGCAVWTEAGTLDPIDCLCCKGLCNKQSNDNNGVPFYYCTGGKMGVDTDCGDIPTGPFPPAPGVTPPDAGAGTCNGDAECGADEKCCDSMCIVANNCGASF